MPKDLQTFVITSVAVTGIGLFWAHTTKKCFETMISIFQNQLLVEDEKTKNIRVQIRDINLLIDQMLADKERMDKKALEAVHAKLLDKEAMKASQEVQELKNKIIEQVQIILSKHEKMQKDTNDIDIGWFGSRISGEAYKTYIRCAKYEFMLQQWKAFDEKK